MAKYLSTKTWGNDRGLSCCFRQWRAKHSHCSLLHGYSIGIKLIFESETLDDKNWTMDFGGLKAFKEWADYMFDHTLIVAHDDPHLPTFEQLNRMVTIAPDTDPEAIEPNRRGAVCDLRVVEAVGCEKFAELAYTTMQGILQAYQSGDQIQLPNGKWYSSRYPVGRGVRLVSAEVFEHDSNSAIYEG